MFTEGELIEELLKAYGEYYDTEEETAEELRQGAEEEAKNVLKALVEHEDIVCTADGLEYSPTPHFAYCLISTPSSAFEGAEREGRPVTMEEAQKVVDYENERHEADDSVYVSRLALARVVLRNIGRN